MQKKPFYLLRRLHGWMHDTLEFYRERFKLRKSFINDYRKVKKNANHFVFLVLTPLHGNLGDHAIAQAEINWLNQMQINYYEVPGPTLSKLRKYKLLGLLNGHTIWVNGGGNLGTLWFGVELTFRELIKKNPRSKIFLFPNTIYYDESPKGKEELRKSIKIYGRHHSLYLCAREHISYDIMKQMYNNVMMVPDMVLSLDQTKPIRNRCGCILCLREDKEKTRSEQIEKDILSYVKQTFGNKYYYSDMIGPDVIDSKQRKDELQKKFEEFKSVELVITDRLHAMIFCAITETPCVVINSRSPKLKGCYEWIKHLGYISFIDNVDEISLVGTMVRKADRKFDNNNLIAYYDSFKQLLKKTC